MESIWVGWLIADDFQLGPMPEKNPSKYIRSTLDTSILSTSFWSRSVLFTVVKTSESEFADCISFRKENISELLHSLQKTQTPGLSIKMYMGE